MKNIYRYILMAIDFACYVILSFLAFVFCNKFQLNYSNTGVDVGKFFAITAAISLAKVLIHLLSRNYKTIWMYRTRRSYLKFYTVTLAEDILILFANSVFSLLGSQFIGFYVLGVMFIFETSYVFASRFLLSIYLEDKKGHKSGLVDIGKRTLIVGAGDAGNLVLSEISTHARHGLKPVAFIDDNRDVIDKSINNLYIYGPVSTINEVIKKLNVEVVIIAMPSAGIVRIKEVTNMIDYNTGVEVQVMQDTSKLLTSDSSVMLRKVSISDLLGRATVALDTSNLVEFLGGKTVLVTGGGGSIGSEICRQVCRYNIDRLVIFDIYENSTYDLLNEFNRIYRKHPDFKRVDIIGIIGSVRDEKRLDEVFKTYHPNIVFHAAAHKHVPLMEDSPKEAIKNNVVGTYNVAKYANKYKVEKMVMISTDKAVNPTNVMGTSKRFAEMVIEAYNLYSKDTSYSMVRFGNVLGSNGSVIPLFQKQIEAGGPVTVTSEKITRFFMTIPEACGLVIQSGAYAKGGEKFILDMGEPVKIIDLAKNMIRLSGLTLDKDISIEITGLRPGEKLYEELLLNTSNATKTENDKIYVENSEHPFKLEEIDEIIKHLLTLEENKEILDYLNEVEKKKKDKK